MGEPSKYMVILALLFLFVVVRAGDDSDKEDEHVASPGQPTAVTYDGRSMMLNGKREFFFSGSIHYPRVPAVVKITTSPPLGCLSVRLLTCIKHLSFLLTITCEILGFVDVE